MSLPETGWPTDHAYGRPGVVAEAVQPPHATRADLLDIDPGRRRAASRRQALHTE